MTNAQNIQITDTIKTRHMNGSKVTAGYKVVLDDSPVFVGTFGECATWGTENMERGANWHVRDARGLVIA